MSNYWRLQSIERPFVENLRAAVSHNTRRIERELDGRGSIFPERVHLNEYGGEVTPDGAVELVERLLAGIGKEGRNKDGTFHALKTIATEVYFSLPITYKDKSREFFNRCIEWHKRVFGCPIISWAIHMDESAPHMHVLACPIRNGQLQAREINKFGREFSDFHRDFMATVALPMGLPNLQPELKGPLRAQAIEQTITTMKAANDPAIHSNWWEAIEKAIKRDPRPFMGETAKQNAIALSSSKSASWVCDEDGVILEGNTKPLTCVAVLNPTNTTTQPTRPKPPEDPGIYRRYTPAQFAGTFTNLLN